MKRNLQKNFSLRRNEKKIKKDCTISNETFTQKRNIVLTTIYGKYHNIVRVLIVLITIK